MASITGAVPGAGAGVSAGAGAGAGGGGACDNNREWCRANYERWSIVSQRWVMTEPTVSIQWAYNELNSGRTASETERIVSEQWADSKQPNARSHMVSMTSEYLLNN